MTGKQPKEWAQVILGKRSEKLTLEMLKEMHFARCIARMNRLFTYDGLTFPQHELEYRAITSGYAGVANDKNCGIMTAWGGMAGVTQYSDVFKKFVYSAPTAKGGTKEIGKDAVILKNTPMMDSDFVWLLRYADLYAHNDISLRMALINSRYQDILKTTDGSKSETLKEWYRGLVQGEMMAIIDDTPLSEFLDGQGDIQTLDLTHTGDVDFTRFTELENELTRSFYRDLGIRWNKDKKANLVSGEVEQDNMMLKYNIADRLKCREEFCDEYNRVFKQNISVSLTIPLESEEVSYDVLSENERLSGNSNAD